MPLKSLTHISCVIKICSSSACFDAAWNSKNNVGFSSIFLVTLSLARLALNAATLVLSNNSHRASPDISCNFNIATVLAASDIVSNTHTAAIICCGIGCNLTVIDVITPNVPCFFLFSMQAKNIRRKQNKKKGVCEWCEWVRTRNINMETFWFHAFCLHGPFLFFFLLVLHEY